MGGVAAPGGVGYSVRALTAADIPAYHALRLWALHQHPEAFGETAEHFAAVTHEQTLTRMRASEARGGCILGAFSSAGELRGVVGLARLEGEKMQHRGLLWGMFVAPEARGCGVGRLLVEECIRRAEQVDGLEGIYLAVVTENTAALKLYRSVGFESYGREPAALKVGGQRYDEFLMVRLLKGTP